MRLLMTEEMLAIWKEVEPYYDKFKLRDDAPEEIKQKVEKLHEMQDKQRKEALRIEYGFDVE